MIKKISNKIEDLLWWLTSDWNLKRIIIVSWLIMIIGLFILSLSLSKADAHQVHLSDLQHHFGPLVAGPSYVEGLGTIVAVKDLEGETHWWLLYKHIDLEHSGVHCRPLTPTQARKLLELEENNQ
ncbi:MAG: hypothetical protein ACXADH_05540 [Candidatus Kariarchaeaceae archaeon]|jgi:hypothetical protein